MTTTPDHGHTPDENFSGHNFPVPPPPPPESTPPVPPPPPVENNIPDEKPAKKGIGTGTLLASVLIAGLIGGGAGAGAMMVWDPASSLSSDEEASAPIEDSESNQGPINRPEDASVVTQAAAKASPSVVSIAVDGGQEQGSGSGVILDDDGHILTNAHVATLGGATEKADMVVQVDSGELYQAKLVGTDPLSDLAVIKVDAPDLTPIEMGSSGQLNVGDQVIAIGAPMGLAGTVTQGIVSQLDRTISIASSEVPENSEQGRESPFEFGLPGERKTPQGQIHLNVIQADASINPGNSGGALLDSQGRLIGINVAIYSQGEEAGSIGLGFAIPADYASRIATDLINDGTAEHALLGVSVTPDATGVAPTENEKDEDETEKDSRRGRDRGSSEYQDAPSALVLGSTIVEVVSGSPADEAGLKPDDIITKINGRRIEDPTALTATIREYKGGDEITLTVERDGETSDVDVTLVADNSLSRR